MLGARFGWTLAALVSLSPGCFSEPKSDLPPGCSLGQHLCPCSDGECDPGLTCSISADVCVSLDCEVGALECPCGMEGACNPGLVCGEYKYCVPEDGSASTVGTDDSVGTMSASMSAGVTTESESDSATMSTTMSVTIDPDTGPTETTDASDSDPSDSDPTTSSTRGESSRSGDDPSMTTGMTDSDSTTTGIDPSISSTAVVTDSDSLGSETTDMTSASSSSTGASSSTTDGETEGLPNCQDCFDDAQAGPCSDEWQACQDAAQMGDFICSMSVTSYINCLQANGGDDDNCFCMAVADDLYVDHAACITAECANDCSCY